MKKIFSLAITVVFALCLNNQQAFSQARLKVTALINYPQTPTDTAIQGQAYQNIRVAVTNEGNNNFFGDVHVYLYSQSLGASAYDTLREGPYPWVYIAPGDTDTLAANPNYFFRINHYAAGDNIIVVWPYSGGTLFESITTHLYLSVTTGINDPHEASFNIYPNPVSKVIRMNYEDQNKVEQVRIYDLAGREVYNVGEAVKTIDLDAAGIKEGIYFLEIKEITGIRIVKKILVTTN